MKGMKKRGKGMNKAKKKSSKKCLACLIVLLFVIGTTIAPAAVAKGDGGAIEKINEKLEAIDEDSSINTFLYNRMLEYNNSELEWNKGIKAVNITVIKGHWWRAKKEVKTFYVVRNDTSQQIDIRDDYKNGDDLWTFYPNEGQTTNALDMLLSHELTVRNVIRMGILAILVDKSVNVPSITEIISKSPWASDNNLPDWAENFLKRFENHH